MRLALKLNIDGTLTDLDLDAPEGSLKVLQAAVGGLIEPIDFHDQLSMYVNEEGKLGGFEPNPLASVLYTNTFGVRDVIMGDVVFTGGVDRHGNTKGLSDNDEQGLRTLVALWVEKNPA